jgi:hypothetical protein
VATKINNNTHICKKNYKCQSAPCGPLIHMNYIFDYSNGDSITILFSFVAVCRFTVHFASTFICHFNGFYLCTQTDNHAPFFASPTRRSAWACVKRYCFVCANVRFCYSLILIFLYILLTNTYILPFLSYRDRNYLSMLRYNRAVTAYIYYSKCHLIVDGPFKHVLNLCLLYFLSRQFVSRTPRFPIK